MRAAGRTVVVGAAALLIAGVSLPAGGGHEAWVARFETVPLAGGSPRAMLVSADGGLVFVMGEADGVDVTVAYDAGSGREVWRRPFDEAARELFEGRIRASSILLDPSGSRLIVAGWRPGTFPEEFAAIAYDPGTGERLWDVHYVAAEEYARAWDPMRVAVSPDGETVFVSGGGWTGAYDARTGQELWRVLRRSSPWLAVAPDGERIYLGSGRRNPARWTVDAMIVARSAATGAVEWTAVAEGPEGRPGDHAQAGLFIQDLMVSPDGSRVFMQALSATGGADDPEQPIVSAYDPVDGTLRWGTAFGARWSFGARSGGSLVVLLSGSDRDPDAWVTRAHDVASGTLLWEVEGGGALLVGPDGSNVYVIGDRHVAAYAAPGGEVLWEAAEPVGVVSLLYTAALTPDGSRLYVAFSDSRMPLRSYPIIGYDTGTGEQVWYTWFRGLRYPGYNAEPRILAMAPDSLTLFVAGENYMHGSLVSGRSVSQGVTVAYDLVNPVPCPGVVSEIAHEAEEPAGPYRGEVRDLNCQHLAPLDPWR